MDVKKRQIPEAIVILTAISIILALITGCEFDNEICSPENSDLKISPSSVFLEAEKTNMVEFLASGGQSNYTWSMNNTNLGTLCWTLTNSAIAIYQSVTNIGTNILTVRDTDNNYANARIVQN